jgi:hypothetical protein
MIWLRVANLADRKNFKSLLTPKNESHARFPTAMLTRVRHGYSPWLNLLSKNASTRNYVPQGMPCEVPRPGVTR